MATVSIKERKEKLVGDGLVGPWRVKKKGAEGRNEKKRKGVSQVLKVGK